MAALKWLVVVMGVLIVVGTLGLVVAVVQRLGGAGAEMAAEGHLGQPAGTRILSVSGAEGRFAVLVSRPDGGERVVLVDARSGRVLGALRAGQ